MNLKFKNKKKIIFNVINKIKKAFILFLLKFNNINANDMNLLRRKIFNDGLYIISIKNSLLKIVLKKTKFNILKEFLYSSVFLIYSLENFLSFKYVNNYLNNFKNKLKLKAICMKNKLINLDINKKIIFLYNINKSITYLVFLIKNLSIIKILNILNIVKRIKNKI